MATIEQIARDIDAIDEPDRLTRLRSIAKAISDNYAPGYVARFDDHPTKDQAMKQDDATFVANTAELLRAHGYTVTPPEADPYTPPCDAPDGFEWVGEYRPPLRGEWCVSGASDHPGPAAYDFCRESPRHILRKLPKTWKPGDKAWVEVQIEDDVESDGEVMVSRPRSDKIYDQYCYVNASALRETPGGGK